MSKKSGKILTLDGKIHDGVIPAKYAVPTGYDMGLLPAESAGAFMSRGKLPLAFWGKGTTRERKFYGISKNHAFQRALAWGRDHKTDPR